MGLQQTNRLIPWSQWPQVVSLSPGQDSDMSSSKCWKPGETGNKGIIFHKAIPTPLPISGYQLMAMQSHTKLLTVSQLAKFFLFSWIIHALMQSAIRTRKPHAYTCTYKQLHIFTIWSLFFYFHKLKSFAFSLVDCENNLYLWKWEHYLYFNKKSHCSYWHMYSRNGSAAHVIQNNQVIIWSWLW